MKRRDENRVAYYIRKHTNFKKWLAFALCISLLAGVFTFYGLHKPATAITEEGAESIGMVLETADSEFEQSAIMQTLSGGDGSTGGSAGASDSSASLASTVTDGEKSEEIAAGENNAEGSLPASPAVEETKSGQETGGEIKASETETPSSDTEEIKNATKTAADNSGEGSSSSTTPANDARASDKTKAGSSDEAVAADTSASTSVKSETGATGATSESAAADSADSTASTSQKSDKSDDAATGISAVSEASSTDASTADKSESGAASATSVSTGDAASLAASAAAGAEITGAENGSIATTDITEFTYEDDTVFVRAVTTSAGVLPKGTELRVTAVDRNTEGYNYDAYMEALNNNAEEIGKAAAEAKGDAADAAGTDTVAESDKAETRFDESNTLLYDIAFIADEKEFQPAEGAVTVSLEFKENRLSKDLSVTSQEDVTVVHLPIKDEVKEDIEVETTEKATEIKADDVEVIALKDATAEVGTEEKVEFSSENFSVFAVVRTVIEKNILASDGNSYHITVTCGEDSGIPRDADITVSELSGEEYLDYVGRASASMEVAGFEYARVFDISIVDSDGVKIQPAAPVEVSVTLLDGGAGDGAYSVVHFEGEKEEESPKLVDAVTEGNAISFAADSFSAYAIVQGPEAIPIGWHKVASVSELTAGNSKSKSGNGFYIGHKDGYYFGNSIVKDTDGTRVGISKTKPSKSTPSDSAALYYFESFDESENHVIAYCFSNEGGKQYVYIPGDQSLSLTTDRNEAMVFTVDVSSSGIVRFFNNDLYWNMQGGINGNRFCTYSGANDSNAQMYIWYRDDVSEDPYELDGKSFGLMNWAGGVAGKAMMASASEGKLEAKSLSVMATINNSDRLFVPNDSDISMWKFNWVRDDIYTISTSTDEGQKYLEIGSAGIGLVSGEALIRVIPGAGSNKGKICLKSENNTLCYGGSVDNGFWVNGAVGSEWLNIVELSELTKDYFLTYTASKVGVSDERITNAARVIVYTRSWNEETLRYDYFAIGSDGSLIPVYESGDSIEWLSGQLNTMLWNFTEYYWEETSDPNYYYELYNEYSDRFIAPQITGNQILAEEPIGINLNGRRDGQYHSPILAWDEAAYQYVGLKVENEKIVSCPKSEAMDFYFAVMENLNVDDNLNEVKTVDNNLYGIKMKIVDFPDRAMMSAFLDNDEGAVGATLQQGLLTTDLKENDYPDAKGGSFASDTMFGKAQEVNHLFIQSTYDETGYFTYDSAQNFATLKGRLDGDFTVYKELGSYDSSGSKQTLKHGQFFPFNNLKAGTFASVNGKNLYNPIYVPESSLKLLDDNDPRKYEQLYTVEYDNNKVNTYFGLELEASFMQTPSGLDEWGHDIIFEFTGDDDFWLYVDGELVIDLGGIHSAVPGNVNFRTGVVNVNNQEPTTLKALFESNYRKRNIPEDDIAKKINDIFEQNSEGNYVFRDDTMHTMRIFYMERGASASNLHMRFNLTAVKKGTVQLTKELSGVSADNVLADFPYQILYKKDGQEYHLTNALTDSAQNDDYVTYKDSIKPVKYEKTVKIGEKEYEDVFFLEPGETADISFPEGATEYRIVECGVNTQVFSSVSVNGKTIQGTSTSEKSDRKDFGIDYATTEARPRVKYTNEVIEDALGTLTIKKKLYAEDGRTEITDDDTLFTFRIYLTSEFDELDVANMQTYYIKDQDGDYCRWNYDLQQFEKIRDGIKDFSELTAEEKTQTNIAFTTSIYGTIENIRPGFTIEFRNLLIGTKYRVEERPGEIPDGYSFMKYVGFDENNAGVVIRGGSAIQGVQGFIHDENSHVDVCNMKGFGIRLNKIWQDADYMESRADAYFALYVKKGTADGSAADSTNASMSLVPDSVRRLSFDDKEQSIYWHYKTLPVDGTVGINDYFVREVRLTGSEIRTSDDGVVRDFTSCEPVSEGETIALSGVQKGGEQQEFTYTVHYGAERLLSSDGTNVRVYEVTNRRSGIVLRKEDWSGNPLQGAVFTLTDGSGNVVGTFTSDENGLITTAFLSDGTYYLTETSAPKTYKGLDQSMTLTVNGGDVTVAYHDKTYKVQKTASEEAPFELAQATDESPATLTVKNRQFSFVAVKVDKDTNSPISGVRFALHRQRSVDGVTTIETTPMEGYESLMTDEDGTIPGINEKLTAETYELREMSTPPGYAKLSGYIRFTISPNGTISLVSCPEDVTLTEQMENDGSLKYVLKVPNTPVKKVSFKKVDVGNNKKALKGAVFDLYGSDRDEKRLKEALYTGLVSGEDGKLSYEPEGKPATTEFELTSGVYYLVETKAPDGYNIKGSDVVVRITSADVTYVEGTNLSSDGNGSGISYDEDKKLYTLLITNSTGYMLPATGGPGTRMLTFIGGMMILLAGAFAFIRRKLIKNNTLR